MLMLALPGACADPADGEPAPRSVPPREAEPLPPGASEEPAPLDPAAVEAMIAEERALDEADRAEYEKRRASMGAYADCMAQVRGAPEQARPRLEEACGRLPDAPRR